MRLTAISLLLLALLTAGCSRQPAEQSTEAPAPPAKTITPAPAATPENEATPPQPAPAATATAAVAEKPAPATPARVVTANKLLNPAEMTEKAPATFKAKFTTSNGDFVIEVTRDWAPNGADRFYNLVKNGYYNDCRFFRVVSNFMVQFGINGDPKLNQVWNQARIVDDPVKESNQRGYVTFAMSSAPNSRTTQVFINYKDNSFLDAQRFAPFGKVTEGMDVVDKLYNEYREAPSHQQPQIQARGNAFLDQLFPELDFIKTAVIMK